MESGEARARACGWGGGGAGGRGVLITNWTSEETDVRIQAGQGGWSGGPSANPSA